MLCDMKKYIFILFITIFVLAGDISTVSAAFNVTVISPNGGEVWEIGKTYSIKWSSQDLPASANNRLSISLVKIENGVVKELIGAYPASPTSDGSVLNDGSENFTVPSTITPGLYKIRINPACSAGAITDGGSWGKDCFSYDDSDATFSIEASLVNVSYPGGGETLVIGNTYGIFWTPNRDDVNIYLLDSNKNYVANIETERGSFSPYYWTIPTTVKPGKYFIRIEGETLGFKDDSNATFNIIATTTDTGILLITVISPNGGEVWEVRSTYEIKWSSNRTDASIHLADNNKRTILMIADLRKVSSPYKWTIPSSVKSGQYYIQISGHALAFDRFSDAPFSIVSKKITTQVQTMDQNEQPVSHEISLQATSENRGVLETNFTSVEYFNDLIIKESKLLMKTSVGEKPINVMPEDAIAVSKTPNIESIKKIELKEESQKPVYFIKGIRRARILFIFPVSFEVETKVSAETGKVISVKKPWWSFLAW